MLLLEKAYAKLHGNYFALRAGLCYEAMLDLTGFPTDKLNFEDDNVQELVARNELFNILKDWDEQGFMISAGTPGEDKWTEGGGPSETGGLVGGHAYSIIQVKEAYNNQLINIRNP